MRHLLVFCAFIAVTCGTWEGGLRVRFDNNVFKIGETFFYEIPKNTTSAASEGWVEYSRPDDDVLTSLVLYCYSNLQICVLYDDTGYVAGLQIAIPQDSFENAVFSWENQGFTQWDPYSNGTFYWTIQQYYVDEDYLATDADTRVAERNPDQVIQLDGVWVRGFDKALLKISSNTDTMLSEGKFTKQACIPWMGQHYYYNMTTDTLCQEHTIFPWFPVYESGQLVALGLMTFGTMAVDSVRNWFERPTSSNVKLIVPNGPQCLYDMVDRNGTMTIHTYLIQKPYEIIICH